MTPRVSLSELVKKIGLPRHVLEGRLDKYPEIDSRRRYPRQHRSIPREQLPRLIELLSRDGYAPGTPAA